MTPPLQDAVPGKHVDRRQLLVQVLFFASGAAALTYQICWNRILFGAFGIDLQSVTIVVATFMLGLGIGALLGGWLSDRWPARTLQLFAAGEAAIALFGATSMLLLLRLGDAFVEASLPVTILVNFLALLIPTTVMGATLPLLVAHEVRRSAVREAAAPRQGVGVATARLYRANTFGAALGAFATGFVAFLWLDRDTVLLLAAATNAAIAVAALRWLQPADDRQR